MQQDIKNIKTQSETFSYTYSAQQQEEVLHIRQKYLPPTEDKMEQLRKLDQRVHMVGAIAAVIVGLLGMVLLAAGLCWTTIDRWKIYFVQGIVVGCVGLALMGVAFFVNKAVTKRMRKRMAPRVIALTDELLQK